MDTFPTPVALRERRLHFGGALACVLAEDARKVMDYDPAPAPEFDILSLAQCVLPKSSRCHLLKLRALVRSTLRTTLSQITKRQSLVVGATNKPRDQRLILHI